MARSVHLTVFGKVKLSFRLACVVAKLLSVLNKLGISLHAKCFKDYFCLGLESVAITASFARSPSANITKMIQHFHIFCSLPIQ